MEMSKAVEIITESKATSFIINSKERILLFSVNGKVAEYKKGSRRYGYNLTQETLNNWQSLTPDKNADFQRQVSNCINLIMNPPSSSSRALDKYFENGDYSKRIVAAIVERCKKNKRLHDILKNEWKWKELNTDSNEQLLLGGV